MYVLAGMNEYGMALMVAIGLNCYFRSGKALRIKVEDIIQPTRREAGPMSIIIFPKERQRASKTGDIDNSCLLDCTRMTDMASLRNFSIPRRNWEDARLPLRV